MRLEIVAVLNLIGSCLSLPVPQQVNTMLNMPLETSQDGYSKRTPYDAGNPISSSTSVGCLSTTIVTSQGTILFDIDNHRLELRSFTSTTHVTTSIEEAILKSLLYMSRNKFQVKDSQIERLEPGKENSGLAYFGCKVKESVHEYMSRKEWKLWKKLVITIQDEQRWPENDQEWRGLLTEWFNVIMEVYYSYK